MKKLVSIIIPVWNRKEDVVRCIKSIKGISYSRYEILIIDDCSTDDTVDAIKNNFKDVKVISMDKNRGAVACRNMGIKFARGDYLCFVDSDNVVDKNFLSELVKLIERSTKIGFVGPKMYYYKDRKRIWFAGVNINMTTSKTTYIGLNEIDCGQYDYVKETTQIPNVWMIRREIVEEVGLMDEDYAMTYGESDWPMRAHKKGYKILYCPTSIVYHDIAITNNASNNIMIRSKPFRVYYFARNRIIFMSKYTKGVRYLIFLLIFNNIFFLYYCYTYISNKRVDLLKVYIKGYIDGLIYTIRKKKHKVKIGVDLRMARGKKCGLGVLAKNMYKVLGDIENKDQKVEIITFFDNLGSIFASNYLLNILGPLCLDYFYKQIILPFVCFIRRIDIFISPSQPSPLWLPCKNIVLIADVVQKFEIKNTLNRILRYIVLPISCKFADMVITISKVSKEELVATYKINKNKVFVLYPYIDKKEFFKINDYTKLKQKYKIDKYKYVFLSIVSSSNKRKNIEVIFDFFHRFIDRKNSIYIIVGARNISKYYSNWCHKNNYHKENFKFLFDTSTKKLNEYLNCTDMFIMSSLYEGFGVPIIESLSTNTKNVIVSDIEVFKEITKGYNNVSYFNPAYSYDLLKCVDKRIKIGNVLNSGQENVYTKDKYAADLKQLIFEL